MSENLKESTAKNFFWAMLSNGTQQVVMLLVGVLLARLLEVSDYGMVAMLTVWIITLIENKIITWRKDF